MQITTYENHTNCDNNRKYKIIKFVRFPRIPYFWQNFICVATKLAKTAAYLSLAIILDYSISIEIAIAVEFLARHIISIQEAMW